MATCLDCVAVYIDGITVCPACGKKLEDEPRDPDGDLGDFVPIMTGWPVDILPAQATLESAGIDARIFDEHSAVVVPTLKMTLQVRAGCVQSAKELLHPGK